MMKKLSLLSICLLALTLAAGAAWAQMGGGQGMMGGPGQMQPPPRPQPPQANRPGYGYGGYGMMGPGMMGGGYGGYGYGPGMMMGGGYGMMGSGMMGMMMGHMMGGGYGGYGMMGPGMMMGSGYGGMMGMGGMLPYLNLSPQQWGQVRALASSRLDKMADLRAKLFQQRLELYNLISPGKVDPAKVKKLFAKMAELKAELFLTGLGYLQQVKKMLTPEQKKQLQGWGYR